LQLDSQSQHKLPVTSLHPHYTVAPLKPHFSRGIFLVSQTPIICTQLSQNNTQIIENNYTRYEGD